VAAAALLAASAVPAAAQDKVPPGFEGIASTRVRLVLNASLWPSGASYGDSRILTEYAEQTTIGTSHETASGFGPDLALQVSLFRGLGILVGYSHHTCDVTGTVDVSRPHPLYLNRPRSASAELSGYEYAEGALDLDLAFAGTAGHLDWALFAGATLFQVEADLLGTPTYEEEYPYDELATLSTPATAVKDSPSGFNVGGRLDYRFGSSRRFGLGIQVRYSSASVGLVAGADAAETTLDLGGLTVGGGVRLYF
jgi:hypothetical protein